MKSVGSDESTPHRVGLIRPWLIQQTPRILSPPVPLSQSRARPKNLLSPKRDHRNPRPSRFISLKIWPLFKKGKRRAPNTTAKRKKRLRRRSPRRTSRKRLAPSASAMPRFCAGSKSRNSIRPIGKLVGLYSGYRSRVFSRLPVQQSRHS